MRCFVDFLQNLYYIMTCPQSLVCQRTKVLGENLDIVFNQQRKPVRKLSIYLTSKKNMTSLQVTGDCM